MVSTPAATERGRERGGNRFSPIRQLSHRYSCRPPHGRSSPTAACVFRQPCSSIGLTALKYRSAKNSPVGPFLLFCSDVAWGDQQLICNHVTWLGNTSLSGSCLHNAFWGTELFDLHITLVTVSGAVYLEQSRFEGSRVLCKSVFGLDGIQLDGIPGLVGWLVGWLAGRGLGLAARR